MTYASNLSEEGIDSQYLLVMAPRRVVSSWTLVSGNVYSKSFDYGHASAVTSDDTVLTEATSVAGTTSGKFYYDYENEILYINVGGSPASKYVVVTYEMYFGTFDAHWYRSPLDSTSREVYYEPLIKKSPIISTNLSDSLFGYLPAGSTQIILSNLTQYFNRHTYDSSFKDADLRLYHQLGDISVSNLKLVYRGLISQFVHDDTEVAFKVLDRTNIFDNEYRNPDATNNFFGSSDFPSIDPNYNNRPIRTVYGFVDGVLGINYDYSETSGTSVNRYFCLQNGTTDLGVITGTVPASPVSTTTRTYVAASGIQVGDDVYLDHAAGSGADARMVITAIGTASGSNYIEHAAIASGATSGSTIRRGWIGNCYVIKNGVSTRLTLDTHYTELLEGSTDVASVSLNQTACESLLGATVQAVDTVYCRVYGKKNSVTLDGDAVGTNSTITGNLTDIIAVLIDILKGAVGLNDSTDIDETTVDALDASVIDEVGFCIPAVTGDNFPILRDLITKICQTALLRIYLDDNGKWAVAQVGPAGAYSKQIEDDEILVNRLGYAFDYQDVISDVLVNYSRSEINSRSQISIEGAFKTVSAVSNIAKRLHKIVKQKTFESLHISAVHAQTLANRLSYYFGDRRGILKLSTKNRFFDTEINDVIRVSRTKLPGYEYDEDTDQTRDLVTQATSKGLTEIEIELDDQKGILDNSGSW